MTYEELLAWGEEHNLTEKQILYWFAFSDCEGIRDMNDRELTEFLLNPNKYDRDTVKGYWEEIDAEGQNNYRGYILDFYNKTPPPDSTQN